jgi:hypothetical protein
MLSLTGLWRILFSPLLEHIVHLPPKDLWPNAETFMKQVRDRARRAAGGVLGTASGAQTPGGGQRSSVSFGQGDGAAVSIRTHLPSLGTGSGEDTDPESARGTATAGSGVKKSTSGGALASLAEGKRKGGAKEGSKKPARVPSAKK